MAFSSEAASGSREENASKHGSDSNQNQALVSAALRRN
jgi:hypothetical protein